MVERRAWRAGSVAVLTVALGATIAAPPVPRLVWNASASAPLGLYRLERNRPPVAGDWAVVRTPEAVRSMAAARHYLPANVPLVKRVAAVAGQRVCAAGDRLTVDGRQIAVRRRRDAFGRPLPWWQGCRPLRQGELLLLGETPDSFDSRYFGPVGRTAVLGRAVLLWAR